MTGVAFVKIHKTLTHLLYECPYAKMVWQYVSFKNKKKYNIVRHMWNG